MRAFKTTSTVLYNAIFCIRSTGISVHFYDEIQDHRLIKKEVAWMTLDETKVIERWRLYNQTR